MSTFESPKPAALPCRHAPISYPLECDAPAFQAMLALWYKAADVMKMQPPGSVGLLATGGMIVMAPLNDELFLFESPDIDQAGDGGECHLIRPQEMHEIGIGRLEFEQYQQDLAVWLRSPVFGESISPEQVARAVRHQYAAESVAEWAWCGNCLPNTESPNS